MTHPAGLSDVLGEAEIIQQIAVLYSFEIEEFDLRSILKSPATIRYLT